MKIMISGMKHQCPRFSDDGVRWFARPDFPDRIFCKLPDYDAEKLSKGGLCYNAFSVGIGELVTFEDDTPIIHVGDISITGHAL